MGQESQNSRESQGGRDGSGQDDASPSAVLMLQLAASQAEIGPFARRGRETPQIAAASYAAASRSDAAAWAGARAKARLRLL